MVARHLKWLSLLSVLGSLGWILDQAFYFGLFGFASFVVLFWYDERMESAFLRAASTAFVVGAATYAAGFVYMAIVLGPGSRNWASVDVLDWALTMLGLGYALFLLTFALGFIYFERRGN